MDIKEIETYLKERNIQYEIIRQDKPILSALDAEGYYPVEKSAPTFVLQTRYGNKLETHTPPDDNEQHIKL